MRLGTVTFFEPNKDFRSEKILAYELGLRQQLADNLTADIATFLNRYDDLRSNEPAGAAPTPTTFKNTVNAASDGAEVTLMYQPYARLFFKGSYRLPAPVFFPRSRKPGYHRIDR